MGSDITETTAGLRFATDHQLLSGCREDVLRKVNGAWKVVRRTMVLDANMSSMPSCRVCAFAPDSFKGGQIGELEETPGLSAGA